MTKKLLLSFAFVGVAFMFGCSDLRPLSGTVTFSDDGSPLTAGAVFFETPTYSARGTIGPDGRYVVGSMRATDGIPIGTYQVTIRGAEDVVSTERPDGTWIERRTALIDAKYQDPDTSGLTFTVDGTRNTRTFDIQVERAR
jgi:hypothetical protein